MIYAYANQVSNNTETHQVDTKQSNRNSPIQPHVLITSKPSAAKPQYTPHTKVRKKQKHKTYTSAYHES
jgi:hypothetical protein